MGMALAAAVMLAQAPAGAVDVAYAELAANRNEAAITRIENNDALDPNDPARLINLGIAHAREGRHQTARELFEAALRSEVRVPLETATGEWVDSRTLARMGLQMLARGDFSTPTRMAAR